MSRERLVVRRAQKRLYDLILDALDTADSVDEYDTGYNPTDKECVIEVDMLDEDACYVGPFVVTITLKRSIDGDGE